VRPGQVCEKYPLILFKHEATGLGSCTQHFTHLFRDSDLLRISESSAYPREMKGSGSYENGPDTYAVTSAITPQGRWTTSDNGLWLHARWPSTLIGKTLWILSLGRRYTGRHCGHNPCFAGRGISSYRISSRFLLQKFVHWTLVRCICGACDEIRRSMCIPSDFSPQRSSL
jgi:hypothetical protein